MSFMNLNRLLHLRSRTVVLIGIAEDRIKSVLALDEDIGHKLRSVLVPDDAMFAEAEREMGLPPAVSLRAATAASDDYDVERWDGLS
jgi:hypothetical protein